MIPRYTPVPKPTPTKAKDKGKPLVRVSYVPDRVAYLIEEGPQQSEIRWQHNGNTSIICNEFIVKI